LTANRHSSQRVLANIALFNDRTRIDPVMKLMKRSISLRQATGVVKSDCRSVAIALQFFSTAATAHSRLTTNACQPRLHSVWPSANELWIPKVKKWKQKRTQKRNEGQNSYPTRMAESVVGTRWIIHIYSSSNRFRTPWETQRTTASGRFVRLIRDNDGTRNGNSVRSSSNWTYST